MKNITRLQKGFHMDIKKSLLDRDEKDNQTILMRYLLKLLISIPQDFIPLQNSGL